MLLVQLLCYIFSRQNRVHLYLQSNTARKGGGACLKVNSKFVVTQIYLIVINSLVQARRPVHLFNNNANFGGAIYVADDTNIGMCLSGQAQTVTVTAVTQSECFFQLIAVTSHIYKFKDAFSFGSNFAKISGSLLYGGLLDRCTVSTYKNTPINYSTLPG